MDCAYRLSSPEPFLQSFPFSGSQEKVDIFFVWSFRCLFASVLMSSLSTLQHETPWSTLWVFKYTPSGRPFEFQSMVSSGVNFFFIENLKVEKWELCLFFVPHSQLRVFPCFSLQILSCQISNRMSSKQQGTTVVDLLCCTRLPYVALLFKELRTDWCKWIVKNVFTKKNCAEFVSYAACCVRGSGIPQGHKITASETGTCGTSPLHLQCSEFTSIVHKIQIFLLNSLIWAARSTRRLTS